MELLEVRNLSKIYTQGENKIKALDNVSFKVDQGEFISIIVLPAAENQPTSSNRWVDQPTREIFSSTDRMYIAKMKNN